MAKKKQQGKADLPDEVRESAQKIWLAGLGAFAAAEEEGGKLFRRLVEKGESFEARGREQVERATGRVRDAAGKVKGAPRDASARATSSLERLSEEVDERVGAALHRLGVPSRAEIRELNQRIAELSEKVERLK